MVIQCDPSATSMQRINHAKYICEHERVAFFKQKALAECFKHVIILVHLNRSFANVFNFEYDQNWFHLLLDDIKPAGQHIPPIIELLKGTELDLLRILQLRPILTMNFRSCLARLIFPYQRSSSDIQEQIESLLKLFNDSEFMTVLEKRVSFCVYILLNNQAIRTD